MCPSHTQPGNPGIEAAENAALCMQLISQSPSQ
jgi:hypothetical protein